jgi:two-component system catabolic regulation response regulator CreB
VPHCALIAHGTRLLLLEDDPAIARTVAYALERDGLQVTHSLLLQDARQQMQRHPFDLLVLDVGLPDGSGLDLLRDVRNTGQPLRNTCGTPAPRPC